MREQEKQDNANIACARPHVCARAREREREGERGREREREGGRERAENQSIVHLLLTPTATVFKNDKRSVVLVNAAVRMRVAAVITDAIVAVVAVNATVA